MLKLKYIIVRLVTIYCLSLFSQIAAADVDGKMHEVDILKFKFSPKIITIKSGDTVRWVNKERRQYHSIWFESLGEPEPDDYFFPGETFERQFDAAGSFLYRCGPHPKMQATIIVE